MSKQSSQSNPFIIQKECKYSLSECLSCYSVDMLKLLASDQQLDPKVFEKMKKAELVSLLKNNIINRMTFYFNFTEPFVFKYFCSYAPFFTETEQQAFIANLEQRDDFEDMEDLANYLLMLNGFIFLFMPPSAKRTEETEIIIPDEVMEAFGKYLIKTQNSKYFPGSLMDFMCYAKVLTMLYGFCTPEILMNIYNRDFPENKITDKKKCLLYMEQGSQTIKQTYFTDGILTNDIISDAKEPIEIIKEGRSKFKQYIPTREEIDSKVGFEDYDEDLLSFKKFIKLLKKVTGDEEGAFDVSYDISYLIKLRFPLAQIFEILSDNYNIVFNEKQIQEFVQAYQDFNNNCHLWVNWGFPPSQIRKTGELSKEIYSDEFLEKRKEARENKPHIELPDSCVVPSKKEAEKKRKEFDAYWDKDDEPPVWHEDGDRLMTRILPEIKKNIAIINEFPEKLFAMISDEWLASLWHANANRGGEFGNQKWDYYVFEPAEKLGENLFTCLLPDGTPIVVYSPAVQEVFDKDAMSCLCVLVEMGGWFVVYGAILWWQGIRTKDFETLAKTVAPQMYDAKGLTGVIHFNPVPFWIAYKSASIPPVAHKGKIVIRCIAETRFSKEGVQKVLKTWKHESAGKYERWILNDEDYLGSATVYLDVKTKAVIIVSFDEELFEQVLEQISDYIDHKHFTEERVSMIMATYLKDKSRKYALLNKCEKIFEKH